MMTCVGIAILTMFTATIAVHLGLPQAIAKVISTICNCHKCLSFWATLVVLYYLGAYSIATALLSISVAYLSNFVALLLIKLQHIYDKLWQRVNRPKQ